MTKTLTEQWREGTLEDGFYYIKKNLCGIKDIKTEELFSGEFCTVPNEYIEEVLSAVPSYTEITLMAGNYRLAKKALRDCYNEMKYWATMNHRCSKIFNHIKAALVEIEEEQ